MPKPKNNPVTKFNQYHPASRSQSIRDGQLSRGYQNIVDHDHATIWLQIPKNANTTIKHALGFFDKDTPHFLTLDVDKYPDYKRIAFVRNPFKRLASCYHWGFHG